MSKIQLIFEKYELNREDQELFSLNFIFSHMSGLPHAGLVVDREMAHEAALLEDPYITRAIGHIAVSAEYYGRMMNAPTGNNRESLVGFLDAHRGIRATEEAHDQIRKAYRASSHITRKL